MIDIDEDKTPYYLLDTHKFKSNVSSLLNKFRQIYGNTNLGYSFKTNYHPNIIRVVHALDEFAEVVSPWEYEMALNAGFAKHKIIYNGVIPDFEKKVSHIKDCGIVNVDSIDEYFLFNSYANNHKKHLKIGLRLNFDIGNNATSRFGIEATEKWIDILVDMNANNQYLKVAGIHCHISEGRELSFWNTRIEKMIEFGKLFNVAYIDLGGNMYGPMEKSLADQFSESPSYADYAHVVGSKMKAAFPDESVKLFLENGTSVVADCGSIFTKVVSTKLIDGKRSFTLDSSVYDYGFIINSKKLPFTVHRHGKIISPSSSHHVKNAILYGYTCTEGDVIVSDYDGELAVGDQIQFRNLGAYTFVMSPNFIMPCPEIVIVP